MQLHRQTVLRFAMTIGLGGAITLAAGCKPGEGDDFEPTPPPVTEAPVIFPDDVRVEDAQVNGFILAAIRTCVDGDYDAFRLLWSAKEEPLTEQEFKRGWRAVREVNIRRVRKLQTPEGEIVYAVRGDVRLDPAEVPDPNRDIVLLLVQENGAWRIARAPSAVRGLLERELMQADPAATQPATTQP